MTIRGRTIIRTLGAEITPQIHFLVLPDRSSVGCRPSPATLLKPAVADSQRGLAATPCHGTARREVPPNKIIHRLSGNPLALWLVINQDLARDTQHLQTNLIVGRSKIIYTNHFLLSESIFQTGVGPGMAGTPWVFLAPKVVGVERSPPVVPPGDPAKSSQFILINWAAEGRGVNHSEFSNDSHRSHREILP